MGLWFDESSLMGYSIEQKSSMGFDQTEVTRHELDISMMSIGRQQHNQMANKLSRSMVMIWSGLSDGVIWGNVSSMKLQEFDKTTSPTYQTIGNQSRSIVDIQWINRLCER